MADLGAEKEKVNAGLVKWFYVGGTDEYVGLVRKSVEYTRGQRAIPTTGLGVMYYSEKLRGRFTVVLAYTSGEVGNSVPQNFDEMIIAASATGEVPESAFEFKTTDTQASPATKTWTITAKCIRYKAFEGSAEGETITELEFQITDANPVVA